MSFSTSLFPSLRILSMRVKIPFIFTNIKLQMTISLMFEVLKLLELSLIQLIEILVEKGMGSSLGLPMREIN